MDIAIICCSWHHNNTKRIVDAIAKNNDITVIDAMNNKSFDLNKYDAIGFSSGIAYGKYYKQIIDFAETNLPNDKKVFFIHTAGKPKENQNSSIKKISDSRNCKCLGTFFCKGYDTFGPFKLVGGLNKNRPDEEDVSAAVSFFNDIKKKLGLR